MGIFRRDLLSRSTYLVAFGVVCRADSGRHNGQPTMIEANVVDESEVFALQTRISRPASPSKRSTEWVRRYAIAQAFKALR
jgi:hypothetical protein